MSYPWSNLRPKDSYSIRRTSFLSNVDQKVLTLLYQPLVGTKAYGLFMTWWSETEETGKGMKEGMLADVLSGQNIGIPEFYQARVRLEAVGLLNTYLHKDRSYYVYEMLRPLSPEDFFNEDILQLLLLNQVGEARFKRLKAQFLLPKWESQQFENITRSFPDVYSLEWNNSDRSELEKVNNELETTYEVSKSPVGETVNIRTTTFDWKFFATNIRGQFVNQQSVMEQKKVIETLHLLYGLDELKMSRYVLAASDPETGKMDANKLKSLVHNNHKMRRPKVTSIPQEEKTSDQQKDYTDFSSADAQLLQLSEKRNPADFLISIKNQKGGFLTKVEQWTLEDIVSQSGLPSPVINILIHYILVVKNNAVFERNLAYKIANDWAQNHVSTPEKAMEKVRQLYLKKEETPVNASAKKNYSKRSWNSKPSGRKETLPDWAKDTNNRKGTSDSPLSEEEQQAFRDRLKKIRSLRKEGEE